VFFGLVWAGSRRVFLIHVLGAVLFGDAVLHGFGLLGFEDAAHAYQSVEGCVVAGFGYVAAACFLQLGGCGCAVWKPPSVSRTCSMLGVMGRSPGMLSKSAADSPMGYSVNRRLSGGGMSFCFRHLMWMSSPSLRVWRMLAAAPSSAMEPRRFSALRGSCVRRAWWSRILCGGFLVRLRRCPCLCCCFRRSRR
jgi:hypothetical protein